MSTTNTALLIEDDPVLQLSQKIVIQGRGLNVSTAGDGKEAIELVMKNRYDFIFVDFGLPDMNGAEITEKLRDIEATENRDASIIIAVTAHPFSDKGEICKKSGMDSYVQKPLSVNKLQQILTKNYHGFMEITGDS